MSDNLDQKLKAMFDAEIEKLPKNACRVHIGIIEHAVSNGMKWKGIAETLGKYLGQKVSVASVKEAFYDKNPDKKPVVKPKNKKDGDKAGKKDGVSGSN